MFSIFPHLYSIQNHNEISTFRERKGKYKNRKGPFIGHNKALVNTLLWVSNHIPKLKFIEFIVYVNVKYM